MGYTKTKKITKLTLYYVIPEVLHGAVTIYKNDNFNIWLWLYFCSICVQKDSISFFTVWIL